MSTFKNFSALAVFIAGISAVHFQILKHPFVFFNEPAWVLLHLLISCGLYFILQSRFKRFTSFLGAFAFAIYPGHSYALASCQSYGWGIVNYVIVLGIAILFTFGLDRFLIFLKTQERLIRTLCLVGIFALIIGMLLISIQFNEIFKDDLSLWRWRAKHVGTPRALNTLADVLRKQAQGESSVDEIISIYDRSIALSPLSKEAYYRLAGFYQNLGRSKDAVAIYGQLLKKDPTDKDGYLLSAAVYEGMDEPKQVIEMYNALLKIYPDDESLYVRVMEGYSKATENHPQELIYQEKREELLAEYEQLTKRKKYTAQDYYNLGFLYEQVGGNEEAVKFYRKAIELSPRYEKALLSLAGRYKELGDLKAALAVYQRLLSINHKLTAAYLNMGIIFNALGDAHRAKYLYQKAIGVDPNCADAYFNLGYLSESSGELREALNFYEKAVEKNPKLAEAYYNMANMYASLEQYPEAIATYLKTVAINPNHMNAYVNLSILSFKSKDFAGAIRYLEEARLLGYTPPEAYLKTLEPYRKK